MDEAEALSAWRQDRPLYEAWGDHLTCEIQKSLSGLIHEPIDQFLKVPPVPRVKSDDSFRVKVQRKLAAEKSIETIDDRVGVRFVVLLTEHIKLVELAVEQLGYAFTKDRDYEAERNARPLEFAYQSVHLVVRPVAPIVHQGIEIPAELACEVQIRTLLQHAHSELTHDRLYKARNLPPQSLNRAVARSMALIEATDNIFTEVASELEVAETQLRELMQWLDAQYERLLPDKPQLPRYSAEIVGKLLECSVKIESSEIAKLFEDKPFLIENIAERRMEGHPFYETSAVLFAYQCIVQSPDEARAYWPLSDPELNLMAADLGISFER